MKDRSALAVGAVAAIAALAAALQRKGSGSFSLDYSDPTVAAMVEKAQLQGESLAMSEFIDTVSKSRSGGSSSAWDGYLQTVQRRAEGFRGRGFFGRTALAPLLEDRLVQSADAYARWLLHDTQILTWWPSKIKAKP